MGNILLAIERGGMLCFAPQSHPPKNARLLIRHSSTAHSAVSPARLTAKPPASLIQLHSLTILPLKPLGAWSLDAEKHSTRGQNLAPLGLRIQFPVHPRSALPLPPRPNPLPQTPTPSNVCLTWAGGIRGVRAPRVAPQQCNERMRGLRVAGDYFTCAAAGTPRTASRGLTPTVAAYTRQDRSCCAAFRLLMSYNQ